MDTLGAMRSLRVLALAALLAFGTTALSALAATRDMNIGDYVLLWATGPYTAPAICQLPGGPRRVARNIHIKAPRRGKPGAKHRLTIEPIGMGEAHCMNDMGAPEPEIEGVATISFRGPNRPDTSRRDFEHQLRRDGGFELEVEAGELKVGVGESQSRVDLKGGTLRISSIGEGSDAARMLGDVGGLPTRTLELEARDGARFVFHAVYVVSKKPPR
jgi:hypothetical protein